MKARLSFVSRRPSAKPDELAPKDRGNGDKGGDDAGGGGGDEMPTPEPMAIGASEPRVSGMGSNLTSAMAGVKLGSSEVPTSPLGATSKSRAKSVADLKAKGSFGEMNVDDEGGAARSGPGGATSPPPEPAAPVFPTSIREGFLKKKGVINVAWKRRYIVLLPNQLAYYDEQPKAQDAMPKGFVRLSAITKVEHHSSDSKTDFKFDVYTPTRIYQFQAESVSDMDAWIASITGTAANEQQVAASRRRNVSHAALAMSEMERMRADESYGISREASELRNWPSWNQFEVAAWLQTFGMARYSAAFYEAGINGAQLKGLTADALAKTCNVQDKADQQKILATIKKLIADTTPNLPGKR